AAKRGGRGEGGGGARGEACAQPEGERLDELPSQRDVVRVLFVARVIREDEGAAVAAREPARGRPQEEGVVGVEDVHIERGDEPGGPPRIRDRERELGIGRRRDRG